MKFSEFEMKRFKKLMNDFIEKRRPPAHVRNQVDLNFSFSKNEIEIFELRADFMDKKRMVKVPVAKAIYENKKNIWEIFWQRADLKWHHYDPALEVKTLEEFINTVDADEHGCFWG